MKRMKFFLLLFLQEPLWFKLLIITTLLASIIFSSSLFSYNGFFDSLSKLATAVFFGAYGFKLRRSRRNSAILFIASAICLYLAWHYAIIA